MCGVWKERFFRKSILREGLAKETPKWIWSPCNTISELRTHEYLRRARDQSRDLNTSKTKHIGQANLSQTRGFYKPEVAITRHFSGIFSKKIDRVPK